jgi:transcriptional regulator with XRE-family HTH domain/tetratricopeptide (TPR) repeat protein
VIRDLPAPDPRRIITRQDFGRELTLAKEAAGLTVRQIAGQTGIPASTVGGYLTGRHLPDRDPPDLLPRLLRACGISTSESVAQWGQAYWRVRRSVHSAEAVPAEPRHASPLSVAAGVVPIPVSIVPPVGRLDSEPAIRGRKRLLDVLQHVVHGRDEARVHVLHGLGGCGKSAVALAAASGAISAGIRCWWLAAHDNAVLTSGLTALALDLGAAPDELRLGSLPDTLWRLLNGLAEPWLLILDGADDPPGTLTLPGRTVTDRTSWLRPPGGRHGAIFVTTRDGSGQTWGDPPPGWLRLHTVPALAAADGADVLVELAGAGAGVPAQAVTLAARLGGLPLALVLAGRYLAEMATLPASWAVPELPGGFAGYLTVLDRGRPGEPPLGESAYVSLGRTWDMSLRLLARRGLPDAAALLRLLSCLGQAAVPYELLLRADVLSSAGPFSPMSPEQLWATLRGLDGVGLAGLSAPDEPARMLALHPVVRHMCRRGPEVRADAVAYLELTVALLTRVVPVGDPEQPQDWSTWRLLADHCAAPLELAGELGIDAPLAAIDLAARAAGFLRAAGHLAQADVTYNLALSAARRCLSPEHEKLTALRHDRARLYYDQGQLGEAERIFRDVVDRRSAGLGDDHPDTLTSRHYLARVLRDRGQLAEAGELLSATLAARLRVLGESHPDTQTSSNGLADLLRVQGELAPAEEIYQNVLLLRGSLLGERHPATLTTRHYLAEVRHHLGQPGVIAELRTLITISGDVRGPDHPRTLAVIQSLTEVLHDTGRLGEAERLARQLVQDRSRVLGPAHPGTLASRHRLGLILLDRGELAGAEVLLTAVLADRRRLLGPGHPLTVLSQETTDAVRHRLSV